MDDDYLLTAPATQLAAAIRSRQIGALELLDAYLNRIARLDGPLGAVVTLNPERARAEAVAADKALARERVLGPLHGLPMTVKDAIATEGIRSTGGAPELAQYVPAHDAPAVARLRSAGAIVFGKTNVPKWSSDLQTYNEVFGVTTNPWQTERVPGGSSGGAAVAVACGFTTAELGTDVAGSIRIPSHFCGVFGLKPSYGIVPQRGYLDTVGGGAIDADLNVFGPIARSADDLDVLLEVLAGPLPESAKAWRLDLPAATVTELDGARVAVWFDEPDCPIAADYRDVIDRALGRLVAGGAIVVPAHPPIDFPEQVELFHTLLVAAVALSHPDEVGAETAGSHRSWLARQHQRARLMYAWNNWFDQWDVLLCPVTPTSAFPHDHEKEQSGRTIIVNGLPRPYVDNIAWTGLVSAVDLPAAIAPLGRTPDGLPVGVQVVAPFLHDRTAIRMAGLVARAAGGGYECPPRCRDTV